MQLIIRDLIYRSPLEFVSILHWFIFKNLMKQIQEVFMDINS